MIHFRKEEMGVCICRICLQSHEGEKYMRDIYEGSSSPTLQAKLLALGFLQVYKEDGLPDHLCTWCAARVNDAFDLKEKCEKSKGDLLNVHISMDSLNKEENIDGEEQGFSVLTSSKKHVNFAVGRTTNSVPPIISNNSDSNTSLILSSMKKMISCLQEFSETLSKLVLIFNNALKFTMDTADLFYSVSSDSISSVPDQKIIMALESTTEDWVVRSTSIGESIDFIHLLTQISNNDTNSKRSLSLSDIYDRPEDFTFYVSSVPGNNLSSSTSGVTELWSHTSPSVHSLSSNSGGSSIHKEGVPDVYCLQASKTFEENIHSEVNAQPQNLSSNASDISGGSVDSTFSYNQDNSRNLIPSRFPFRSELLSSQGRAKNLTVKRKADSGVAVKQKRKKKGKPKNKVKKSSCSHDSDKFLPLVPMSPNNVASNFELGTGSETPKDILNESLFNCQACGKEFMSLSLLQDHLNTVEACKVLICSYCGKKFSTSWNRTQHERCHTGLKPYMCDVCGEAFRYNVSMRQHKARIHSAKQLPLRPRLATKLY